MREVLVLGIERVIDFERAAAFHQSTGNADITIELSSKPVRGAQISFAGGCENADTAMLVIAGTGTANCHDTNTTITENGCASGGPHTNTGGKAGFLRAAPFALHANTTITIHIALTALSVHTDTAVAELAGTADALHSNTTG